MSLPGPAHAPHSHDGFYRFSAKVAGAVGKPWAFITASTVVVAWALSGPIFHFSDTWQLVINTSTTIITFLMVFLIQNTQNRDASAIHLKLDELLRGVVGARNSLIDLENMSDEQLRKLREEFHRLRLEADAGDARDTLDARDNHAADPTREPLPAASAKKTAE